MGECNIYVVIGIFIYQFGKYNGFISSYFDLEQLFSFPVTRNRAASIENHTYKGSLRTWGHRIQ